MILTHLALFFFDGAGGEAAPAVVAAPQVGGVSRPWKQKWRQQLVDALEEIREQPKPLPRASKRAVERAEKLVDLPDDAEAIEALKAEVSRLQHYKHIPAPKIRALERTLAEAWRQAIDEDDEDVILLLH